MSPVLLDHRNLKWAWFSIVLLIFIAFFSGYIVGFEKSNTQWMAKLEPVAIDLPNVITFELTETEAQPPEFLEPGFSIDVDSVDVNEVVESVVVQQEIEVTTEEENIQVADLEEPVLNEQVTPLEPAEDEVHAENSGIVETANVENARYSIQVGMYSSFDNAAKKVEQLLIDDLNPYIHEYKNQKNEIRYNVRFGYFATFSSAGSALKVFQQSYGGSGYIARIKH